MVNFSTLRCKLTGGNNTSVKLAHESIILCSFRLICDLVNDTPKVAFRSKY